MRMQPEPSTRTDLTDPETYASGSPHRLWQEQRRRAPVAWIPVAADLGYWSVTSHAGVAQVLRDSSTFSSARGTMLNLLGKHDPAGGRQLAASDPPEHTRLRAPIQKALAGRLFEQRQPQVRAGIRQLLADVAGQPEIDLAVLTQQVPTIAAGSLIGLPSEDYPMLTRLSHLAVAAEDPEFAGDLAPEAALQTAHRELFGYLTGAVASLGSQPQGLIKELTAARDEHGRRMPAGAIVANCYSLILGAIVTTPQVPNALVAELAARRGYRAWAEDPEALDRGLEEALRWSSPTVHFMRHATTSVRLGDQTIGAGDPVVAWLASANRDEKVFDRPYALDAHRQPNRHIAFGVGPHYCVGHAVARATLTILFEEIFAAIADVEPAGPPTHLRSNFLAGLTHLPLRVTWRAG